MAGSGNLALVAVGLVGIALTQDDRPPEALLLDISIKLAAVDADRLAGTFVEFVDDSGAPLVGVGVATQWGTRSQHDSATLQAFVRDRSDQVSLTDLGKGGEYYNGDLGLLGDDLVVIQRLGDGDPYLYDRSEATWVSTSQAGLIELYLGRPSESDCGPVQSVSTRVLITRNCAYLNGRPVYSTASVESAGPVAVVANLLPTYVSADLLVLESVDLTEVGFVLMCPHDGSVTHLETCDRVDLPDVSEFHYAITVHDERVLITTNHCHVLAYDRMSRTTDSIAPPATATAGCQYYASLEYGDSTLLGQFPDGEIHRWNGTLDPLEEFAPPSRYRTIWRAPVSSCRP